MTLTIRGSAFTACALAAFFGSVSCGSDQVGGSGSASASPAASKSVAGPSAAAPAGSAVPASVRPSIQPTAKDGTNYEACRGGDCEIAVRKPVTITLADSPLDIGAGPFKVEKVRTGSVKVSMGLPAGPSITMTIDVGCTTAFFGNNASGFAIHRCSKKKFEDIRGMYVKQLVTVKRITDGTAILVLTSE